MSSEPPGEEQQRRGGKAAVKLKLRANHQGVATKLLLIMIMIAIKIALCIVIAASLVAGVGAGVDGNVDVIADVGVERTAAEAQETEPSAVKRRSANYLLRPLSEPANNEKPFASMLNLAVINGKVSLPCDISPASADDSVALVLWYKDDSSAPIYTMDARKVSSTDKAKISAEEAYSERASFNTRTKPAQLQLERVRQEDEGDYRCRVDFKRGRTVNTIISLRVVVPPDEVRIVHPARPNQRLEGLIGPFNEGAELALLCIASGGKPRPQISWRRDFNVIDDTHQQLDKEGTSNELKITSLSKNHLLSIFSCQASNNNLTAPLQSSITLDLNLKPQEILLRQVSANQQEPLIAGQTATFECLTHGSRPQATIHWIFQGLRHDTPINVDQQQTSTRLTLPLQRSFNQQPLTCVAENPRIPQSSALRQTIKLDVHYPPQLSIRLEPPTGSSSADSAAADNSQTAQLQEGNDIYLTCHVDANPRPVKPILWRFNGKPLSQQQQQLSNGAASSSMIVMNNQSLVLRKVARHQSGAYTCEATNLHGTSASQPLDLVMKHAPVCATDDILIFEASSGQTINIDCNVLANPPKSVHYSWFWAPNEANLSNWVQRDAGLDEQIDESSSRLKFKIKPNERSFGLIKCKAKNEIGLQQRACLFRVMQAPAPKLSHQCRAIDSGGAGTSLQVSCEPSEQLKSEEFELVSSANDNNKNADQSSRTDGMSQWLSLESMGRPVHQQPRALLASPSADLAILYQLSGDPQHQQRVVFPPNWLLAEVYKWPSESLRDKESDWELAAYVLIGASSQLHRIKSIVEDNHLFSAHPKTVYYVPARIKQPFSSNSNSSSSNSIKLQQANETSLMGNRQQLTSASIGNLPARTSAQQTDLRPIDQLIQLPDSFTFTVPSLQPRNKYKLLIYGQNLANKTRDWLVVTAETESGDDSKEPTLSPQQIAPSAGNRELVGAKLLAGSTGVGSGSMMQKSIVMRSDTAMFNASLGPHNSDQLQEPSSQSSAMFNSDGHSLVDNSPSASPVASLAERFRELSIYKEYAISYAKQKPLLAAPAFMVVAVLIIVLVSWTASLLVNLIRGGNAADNLSPSSSEQKSPLPISGNGGGRLSDANGIGAKKTTNGHAMRRNSGSEDDTLQRQKSKGLYQQHHNHRQSAADRYSSPPSAAESSLIDCGGGGGSGSGGVECVQLDELVHQMQQQLQTGDSNFNIPTTSAVYTIDSTELDGCTSSDLAKIYQQVQGHNHHQQPRTYHLGNSLDRRASTNLRHQQPIYLSEFQPMASGADCQPIYLASTQLASSHIGGYHRGGSIDRRLPLAPSSFLPAGEQQQQPPPLLIADLGSLANQTGAIYHLEPVQQQQQHHHQPPASGSCSSADCPSNSTEYHQPHRARPQRVAFDLSNQTQSRADRKRDHAPGLSPNPSAVTGQYGTGNRRCVIVAPSSAQESSYYANNNSQQQQHHLHQVGKGSDSGASNSGGNTADSGHESPNTGETTTSLSYTTHALNCPALQQQQHAAHLAAGSSAQQSSSPSNLVMLMELSPGSQESSTLMQSVDSSTTAAVATTATGTAANGSKLQFHQLLNNHQMATSFASH